MSPTRELATQIFHVLRKVGKFHRFRTTLIIGGSGAKVRQLKIFTYDEFSCSMEPMILFYYGEVVITQCR